VSGKNHNKMPQSCGTGIKSVALNWDREFVRSSFQCAVCRPGLGEVYAAGPSGATAAPLDAFAPQWTSSCCSRSIRECAWHTVSQSASQSKRIRAVA